MRSPIGAAEVSCTWYSLGAAPTFAVPLVLASISGRALALAAAVAAEADNNGASCRFFAAAALPAVFEFALPTLLISFDDCAAADCAAAIAPASAAPATSMR